MPEVVHGYCSVDDLRDQFADLRNPQLSESLLIRAINAASRAVDNHTGRRFWTDEAPTTREYTPQYGDCALAVGDITTTVGLVITTDDAGDGTYTGNWATTDYRLKLAMAGRYPTGPWNVVDTVAGRRLALRGLRGPLPVRVTARFGWPDIPPEVETATILKAGSLFKRKDAPFGVIQFGDVAALRIGKTDGDVMELLSDYVLDVAMVG